ncbi:hypothetical protein HWV62_30765 [Athelia sp. TMB]|nr:hypothetical protein HWV62_30765 [Athelia sp. TMB]
MSLPFSSQTTLTLLNPNNASPRRMDSPSTSDHTSDTSTPPPRKHRSSSSLADSQRHRDRDRDRDHKRDPSLSPLSPLSPLPHHRSTHGHHTTHSKRRSKDHGKDKDLGHKSSARELARLLVFEEREIKELQRALFAMTEQLKQERQRADDADRKALEAAWKWRESENSRVAAEGNYARATEELRLYKIELEKAQQEIYHAQKVISDVDNLRQAAEEDAARSRTTARQLKEETLLAVAREEGRRLGIREGIERGREAGWREGREEGWREGREEGERAVEVIYEDWPEERHRDRRRDRGRGRREEEETTEPETEQLWERNPHGHASYDPRSRSPSRSRDHSRDPRDTPRAAPRGPPSSAFDPRRFVAPPGQVHSDRTDVTFPPNVHIPETPIHSVPPTPRAMHDIPPDNWIPDVDADARIRLPPPHEMQRSPVPRTPSPALPPVPEMDEREEVLPVPPPEFEVQRSRSSGSRHRKRSSSPSSETSGRTSELDLLAAPRDTRGIYAGLAPRLSVIREGNSVDNTPSVGGNMTMRTASTPTVVRQPSMTLRERERETPPRAAGGSYYRRPRSPEDDSQSSGMGTRPSSRGLGRQPSIPVMPRPPSVPTVNVHPPSAPGTRPPSAGGRPQSVGGRPPSAGGRPPSFPQPPPSFPQPPPSFPQPPPSFPQPPSSFSQPPPGFQPMELAQPMPTATLAEPKPDYRRSSSSSVNSEIEIDIQPPSRPQSNSSKEAAAVTSLLSPRDADRPIPLPGEGPSHAEPEVINELPPGFVATGPPQPDMALPPAHAQPPPSRPQMHTRSSSGGGRVGYTPRTSIYGPPPVTVHHAYAPAHPPVVPGGFPPMGDQYMSMSSSGAGFRTLHDDGDEPYIPMPTTMPVIPPPSSNYKRYTDEESSSTSDADTLSTPPARKVRLGKSRADDYAYDPAPMPVPPPIHGHIYQHQSQHQQPPARRGSATPKTRPISIYGAAATMESADQRPKQGRSSGSYKHFDKQEYLDPAHLASASSSVEDVSKVGLASPGGARGYGSGRRR